MKCIIYARVSTQAQAERELSIPAQLLAARNHARERGWEVLEEFTEAGASGRTADRPALRALLSRCRLGAPKVDIVLVHKIDRLARNLVDHLAIKGLLKSAGAQLASVVEHLEDTTSGVLVENIMAALAEFYSANLSEETKKGMRQRISQGGWTHQPPLGYRVDRDGKITRIVPDAAVARYIRKAFELVATENRSLPSLSSQLFALGFRSSTGKPIGVSTLSRLLRNSFYAGMVRWHNETFPGAHEPLVTRQTFDRVQERMAARNAGRILLKHDFWLRGKARCRDCRGFMTAEVHGSNRYYRCMRRRASTNSCRSRFANAARVESDVLHIYGSRQMNAAELKRLRDELDATRFVRSADVNRRRSDLAESIDSLERRRVALSDAFASGLIEIDTLQLTCARLDEARVAMQAELDAIPTEVAPSVAPGTLLGLHASLDRPSQKQLLDLVFDDLVISQEGVASYEWNEAA